MPALGHVWALRAPTGSSSETAGDLYLQRTADSVYEYTSSDLYVRGTGLHTDPDSSDGDSFGYHHYYLYLPLYARDLPSYSPNTNWYWNNTTIGGIGLGWLPATGSEKVFSLNGQSIYYALYNTSMLAASSIDFGRVMAGSYQSTKLWVSRTGEGTALISSATAEGPLELIVYNTVVNDTPRDIDVILDTGTTGKLADSKITLVNTANNVYGPQTLTASVGGTVVANREVTGEADISHKKVLVNHLLTGQVDITSAGDRDNFADVTVLGTAVTNGNVTVEAGGDTLFNGTVTSVTRNVAGFWTTAGVKSGTIDLNVVGEAGLVGQTASATVTYTDVHVFEPVQLSATVNGGSPFVSLTTGSLVTLSNAAATTGINADRAEAAVTGVSFSTPAFVLTGLSPSATIAGGGSVQGTVAFNPEYRLLGGDHTAQLRLDFAYADSEIVGIEALNSMGWTVSAHVPTNTPAPTGETLHAWAATRGSLRYSARHTGGKETLFESFGTVRTPESQLAISASFTEPAPSPGVEFLSDILSLDGTASETFILQLSYDDAALTELASNLTPFVGFLSDIGKWENATEANSGREAYVTAALLGYKGSFLQALALDSVDDLQNLDLSHYLGAYGWDAASHKAWAVINHNSLFAVVAVPESSAWGIGMVVLLAGLGLRRLTARVRGM